MKEQITVKIKQVLWADNDIGKAYIKVKLLEENERKKELLEKGCCEGLDLSDFIAKGIVKSPAKEDVLILLGEFSTDTRGRFFKVLDSKNGMTQDENILFSFLTSSFISGIPHNVAKEIVLNHANDFEELLSDEKFLKTIHGVGKKRAQILKESFSENNKYFRLFKVTKGLATKNIIDKIVAALMREQNNNGSKSQKISSPALNEEEAFEKAEKLIKEDPYVLIKFVDGIGFAKADKLASSLGYVGAHKVRVGGSFSETLRLASENEGHVFLKKDTLKERAKDVLFPLSKMKEYFYFSVLKQKEVPFLLDEWESLAISKLSVYKLKDLLFSWLNAFRISDYNEKEEIFKNLSKKYRLSALDIDFLDTYCVDVFEYEKVFEQVLEAEIEKETVVADGEEKDDIYQKILYDKEVFIKDKLLAIKNNNFFARTFNQISDEEIALAIERFEQEESEKSGNIIRLGKEQIEAEKKCCKESISIITGGPGRGKTATIKILLDILLSTKKIIREDIKLLAPTGRAASRMKEAVGSLPHLEIDSFESETIHRFNLRKEDGFSSLPRVLILDEFSMADIHLFYSFLKKISTDSIIFLIGDIDQLPSIGAGTILKSLIDSEQFPVARLIKCYRNEGSIIENVISVNKGKTLKSFVFDNHTKGLLFESSKEAEILNTIYNKFKSFADKTSPKDVCIITSRRKGTFSSAVELNRFIQEKINPVKKIFDGYGMKEDEIKIFVDDRLVSFRTGDRVIHTKNNYEQKVLKPKVFSNIDEKQTLYSAQTLLSSQSFNFNHVIEDNFYQISEGCFNGETGTVIHTDIFSKTLIVLFDDGKVSTYGLADLFYLDLAYAITTHKSQGSEYANVIFLCFSGDFILLERNLIYTAISRAKKNLFLIIDPKYMNLGIQTVKDCYRLSKLSERLKVSGSI